MPGGAWAHAAGRRESAYAARIVARDALRINSAERSRDRCRLLRRARGGVVCFRCWSSSCRTAPACRSRTDITIGRAPGSTVQLDDPAVSRRQARIVVSPEDGTAVVEDAGSSYGTWLDGRASRPRRSCGTARDIRVGNQELLVERRREDDEAGRTVVVEPGASSLLPAADALWRGAGRPLRRAPEAALRLRAQAARGLRGRRALGAPRPALRPLPADVRQGRARSSSSWTAGARLPELVRESKRLEGPAGPLRLVRLLAELADRGLLAGVAAGESAPEAPRRLLARLGAPRQKKWQDAGRFFDRVYARGGRRLFTAPALTAIALIAVAGLVVFPYLVVGRYGTPFVVAQKIGFGALVFLLGRFAVAARPRDGPRAGDGRGRAASAKRRRQAGVRLPLCVRRHVRGVVRATATAGRHQRRRPDRGPHDGCALRAGVPGAPGRHRP